MSKSQTLLNAPVPVLSPFRISRTSRLKSSRELRSVEVKEHEPSLEVLVRWLIRTFDLLLLSFCAPRRLSYFPIFVLARLRFTLGRF